VDTLFPSLSATDVSKARADSTIKEARGASIVHPSPVTVTSVFESISAAPRCCGKSLSEEEKIIIQGWLLT
jgi:hypothetical protein